MKFGSFFMCFIILVLGLVPCKDSNALSKPLTKLSIEARNQHSSPLQDQCSPFCHCSCCNAPSVVTMRVQLYFISFQLNNSYPELAPLQLKNRELTIWQPPKFVA
ncbi:hypothetical protein [Mucilaginibacter sp. P4]|uniref:hypothetical protein n=1 Tax=Mucilaginibacter TaxID=423349 RepID=UPI00389AA06E